MVESLMLFALRVYIVIERKICLGVFTLFLWYHSNNRCKRCKWPRVKDEDSRVLFLVPGAPKDNKCTIMLLMHNEQWYGNWTTLCGTREMFNSKQWRVSNGRRCNRVRGDVTATPRRFYGRGPSDTLNLTATRHTNEFRYDTKIIVW